MNPVFRVARLQWRDRAGFSPASLLMPNMGTREHRACTSDSAKRQARSVRDGTTCRATKCRATKGTWRKPAPCGVKALQLRAVDPLVQMRDLRFR